MTQEAIVFYVGTGIAVLAAVAAVVSAVHADRQAKAAERQAKLAEEQVQQAKAQAEAARVQAEAATAQVKLLETSVAEQRRANDLHEKALMAQVQAKKLTLDVTAAIIDVDNKKWLEVKIANNSEQPAHIERIEAVFANGDTYGKGEFAGDIVDVEGKVLKKYSKPQTGTLNPGKACRFKFCAHEPIDNEPNSGRRLCLLSSEKMNSKSER